MNSLVSVLVCVSLVLVFGSFLLAAARFFSLKAAPAQENKKLPFECGLKGEAAKASRVPVQFYLTAVLFILFDIEIIFLFPWALAFDDFIAAGRGGSALLAMGIFLMIFVYGLMWEVGSKALDWKS